MITPQSEAELAELLADANAPLTLRGGGTRGLPKQGDLIDSSGFNGIELYEPGALTVIARSGTPLSDLNATLAKENQRLAFEPMDHRGLLGTTGEPTIGGVVAGNISGPRRIQAGACRDFLLGVRYVDGRGTIIKNGGRVMKNVTGYDLVKLMAGSWGTLGMMTEVSLKVLPIPDTQATILISGLDASAAVSVMSKALGSPFEVSAAAFDPAPADGESVAMLRIEGFEESVRYRVERVTDLVGGEGQVSVVEDPGKSEALWKAVRDVDTFHDAPGDVWRLSVKPSDGPEIAQRLQADALLFDWGGGLIWARVPADVDLRARAGAFDGHATLVRASDATRTRLGTFHPEHPVLARISAQLRAKFDPRGLFNPSLMSAPESVPA